MIKNMPLWARIAWWVSVLVLVALAGMSIDTLLGIESGRYDAMAALVFNYLIIPIGGSIVIVWGIVFAVRGFKSNKI